MRLGVASKLGVSSASLVTYGVLVATMIAVELIFLVAPRRFPLAEQASALSWVSIAVIASGGVFGLLAASRIGFADMGAGGTPPSGSRTSRSRSTSRCG